MLYELGIKVAEKGPVIMTNPLITRREKQEEKDTILLHIKGRLDMNALEDFKNIFADEFDTGNFKIVLNMSQVNFIVSTHLGVIMSNYKKAQSAGGDIKFSSLTEEVYGIFDLLQLTTILNIYNSDAEALAEF